jgi:hypothetical protein
VEGQTGTGVLTILVDHNIEGHAMLLWGTLTAEGWPDLIVLRMVIFPHVGLSYGSSDREVWRFAQAQHMRLLTANRRMQGEHTLEHTIREENTPTSLPVLTIGNADRMLDKAYRERCAMRLVEIGLDLENYLGTGASFHSVVGHCPCPSCRTRQWSRRPTASARTSLQPSGAAHRQR